MTSNHGQIENIPAFGLLMLLANELFVLQITTHHLPTTTYYF